MDAYRLKAIPRAAKFAGAALIAAFVAAPAMAQPHHEPYYDPVRDVMVTPSRAVSDGVITETYRSPVYGAAPIVSSNGAVTPVSNYPSQARVISAYPSQTAYPSQGGASQPYYDPARDVMVTPTQTISAYPASIPMTDVNTFEFVVRRGQLAGGPASIVVDHGSEVTFVVDSDLADALRVDGYNLSVPLIAGQPVLVKFTAEQPGRFVYRLGRTGRELGVLEVGPPKPTVASR